MSISLYQCTNIDQFHHAGGYAALYTNLSSRISRDDHDDGDLKSAWVIVARTLCERDSDREWIKKWSSNSLTYGGPGQTNPSQAARLLSVESDELTLFIDTSWHLLRNEEPEAIKVHDIRRSQLNLSSLPNGFRFIDIVVDFPAKDLSMPLGQSVKRVDNTHRKTANPSKAQIIGLKYLDRNRSLSPLTDLEEHEGQPSFARPRKKIKGRHSQPDNHQPTNASIKLRRRRSQRLATVSSEVPQHHIDEGRSIMNDTNISQSYDLEETMSSEKEPLSKTDRSLGFRKIKKGAVLATNLSIPGGMSAGNIPSIPVQIGHLKDGLPVPLAEDYDTHVTVAGQISPSQTNLKRKVTLGAYKPDLEREPPRKKLGRDINSMAESRDYSGKSNQQRISNCLPVPEPVTIPPSQIECETIPDTIVQQPENMRQKKGKKKGKVRGTQPESTTLPAENDVTVHQLNIYTPMAGRRIARSAAHKAQEKIHEQYLIDPYDPLKDVVPADHPPDRRRVNNRFLPQEVTVDDVHPVNTVIEPSNPVRELESEPLKGVAKENGEARKPSHVKKKVKGKRNREAEGKGKVNLGNNEGENSTTLPTITIDNNPNTSESELVSVANVSHSTTCASSPTAVAGSSSSTAYSSPPTTPANDMKKPAWASLHFKRVGPSRKKKQSEKPTISLPEPDLVSPPTGHSQCRYEDQSGSHDGSDAAFVQPVQQPVEPVQAHYPPWSAPHDGTNYSNGFRNPGSNDTHSWEVSKSRTVEFPPLQGESLCPDIRLHKPELPNQPPVWSHSRQELCESLSYFRAYQGGVYTHKQRAEGYLLDGYPARYDIWHSDGRYIISHGGGHSAVDRLTGRTSLVEDQASDSASCAALISTWKAGQPIALIAGSGYRLFPFSLGEKNYIVLGYYHIVHAWEEPEPSTNNPRGYCVRWKFLFRWIEAQGSPWWLDEDERPTSSNAPFPSQTCASCNQSSCHIFSFGWVCTHSDCHAFFQLSDKSNITHEGYNLDFLASREDPPGLKEITLDIRPKPPVRPIILPDNTERPQLATSRHFWKGFWCEKCGKLSCREFWTYWKCSSCKHMLVIKATIQVPPSVGSVKMKILFDRSAGIEEKLVILGDTSDPYRCHTFILPFNRGRIHVIKASQQSLQIANRIFQQYQLDASNDEMFFRRYSMKTHKLKGRMLSHYFSQNSGEPYAYVGGTNNTVELNKYRSVTKALDYIRTRAMLALNRDPGFNEVLSAAYMEEQKMEYHSDGEKDLGPIVASLSLGSPAIMKFRPVPSKWTSSDGQMKEGRKTPPVIIELTLRHGDALVMEGAEIQEYYQHAVHPCGFRIAATARRVNIT